MNEPKHFPWEDGLPTKPDVDALIAAYPPKEIQQGKWMVHDEHIRDVIGHEIMMGRFRTVTNAWRKRLVSEFRVNIFRLKSIGFYCPTPDGVFEHTDYEIRYSERKFGRQLRRVSIVVPENQIQKAIQEHQGQLLHALRTDARKTRRNILPSTLPDMPAISPPSKREQKKFSHVKENGGKPAATTT